MREEFDAKIMDAFQKPLMDDEGYESWDEYMEDYQFAHAGKALAAAMITGVGPTPDRFFSLGLHHNLHGLEDIEYIVRNDRPGYKMQLDQTGSADDPFIFVFENGGAFDIEMM